MKIRRIDFSPDEWLAGTAGLDNAERGLYITACALIYSHGGPIPIDELRRHSRDHGNAFNRQLSRLVTTGKLQRNGSDLANKRCEDELEKARKRAGKGKELAAERWKNNGVDSHHALRGRNGNHQPSTTNKQVTSEANASEAVGEPSAGASELAPLDAASVLIGRCTAWLSKATGRQEKSLRGLVVRMLKRYGDGAVLEVFTAASRAPPVDPVAWIEAKLQQREGRNGRNGKIDPITGWYAGFNEAIGGSGPPDSEPDSTPDGALLGRGYAH